MAWIMRTKGSRGRLEVSVGGLKIATLFAAWGRKKGTSCPWYVHWHGEVLVRAAIERDPYSSLSDAMKAVHALLQGDPDDTAYLTGDEQRARRASEGK